MLLYYYDVTPYPAWTDFFSSFFRFCSCDAHDSTNIAGSLNFSLKQLSREESKKKKHRPEPAVQTPWHGDGWGQLALTIAVPGDGIKSSYSLHVVSLGLFRSQDQACIGTAPNLLLCRNRSNTAFQFASEIFQLTAPRCDLGFCCVSSPQPFSSCRKWSKISLKSPLTTKEELAA